MRCISIAAFLIMFAASPTYAHPVNGNEYDPRSIVSDLNVIAPALLKAELTNGDVRSVAGAACSTFRVARQDRLFERMADAMNKDYPSAKVVSAVSQSQFLEFEIAAFRKAGADETALKAVAAALKEHGKLPESSPAQGNSLAGRVEVAETAACEIRSKTPEKLDAPAEPGVGALAISLGWSAMGAAAIVANAAIAAESGGTGAVLGMISGGWGWNRIEEEYPNIKEGFSSLFK